ncbi:MAG TPA: type II CAAX endopeptidase family protein [Acidobacteriota bacterium]|nr:type II CAAX endopeptidase family protein [Acidobacteriota bacterium]
MEETPRDAPENTPQHDAARTGQEKSPQDLDPPRQPTWWLWLLLSLFVGAFMVLAFLQQQELHQSSSSPLTQPLGDLAEDPHFRLTSRYALGVYRLSKMGIAVGGSAEDETSSEQLVDSMLEEVESSAATLVSRLRTVPVLAEMRGRDAALQRLEEVKGSISAVIAGSGDDQAPSVSPQSLEEDAQVFATIYQQGSDSLSQEQRQRLIDRHHWYARLALEQGGDESVSAHSVIWRTTIVLLSAGLGLLAAAATGFVLLAAAILLFAREHLRTHYRTLRSQSAALSRPLLEVVVFFLPLLLMLTVIGEGIGQLLGGVPLLAIVLWGALLAPLWPLLRGVSRRQLRQALGWNRGRGAGWEVLSGVGGYLAGIPVMAAGVAATFFISQVFETQPSHPAALEALSGGFWQILQIYLLACVWAPVVEESVFRGALFSHLRMRYSGATSALLSGIIFAAIHPQGLAALPVLTAIGFVLAMLREWRDSLIAPMTAHALNNFLAITLLLLLFR